MMSIVEKFIIWLVNNFDYSENTINCYRDGAKIFFSQYKEFNQENAREFIYNLSKEGRKHQTIALRISCMYKIAEFLGVEIKIKRPKYQKQMDLDNVPSSDEFNKLCEYIKMNKNDYYILIRILGTTGCRISELKRLTYELCSSGEAIVLGKGNKYRRFFFTDEIISMCKGKSGVIMKMTTRGFSDTLKRLGSKAGIDKRKLHPHAFRHYFAKMYLKNSRDVVQLAEFLGHSSVDTTRIYLKKTKEEQKEEFKKFVNW